MPYAPQGTSVKVYRARRIDDAAVELSELCLLPARAGGHGGKIFEGTRDVNLTRRRRDGRDIALTAAEDGTSEDLFRKAGMLSSVYPHKGRSVTFKSIH